MCRASRSIVLLTCWIGLGALARADGGMFPQPAGSGESADQRAVVAFDNGRQTLILQTAYAGDRGDFAWVIPVPIRPQASEIGTVATDIFDDLYELTEPTAIHNYDGHAGCMPGCSSSGSQQYRSVKVWETLQVDEYEVSVLSTSESSDLVGWLNSNGYGYPSGHQEELDYYVNKSWFFVAAKISPEVEATTGGAMRPLRLTFDASEPVYPLRISAVSSHDEVEVLLYVVARHRVTLTNYNSEEIKLTSRFGGGNFSAYYEGQFRDSLARAGASSMLVEYAGRLPDDLAAVYGPELGLGEGEFFITRLRTYLTQNEMQEDVVMTQAGSDDSFAIRVAAGPDNSSNVRLAALSLFFVLGTMLALPTRSRVNLMRSLLLAGIFALLIL